jgi:hypothetical protein
MRHIITFALSLGGTFLLVYVLALLMQNAAVHALPR